MTAPKQSTPLWIAAAPGLFVLFWASGFPVTRLGVEYAEPLTLLTIRSGLNVLVVAAALPFLVVAWPKTWREAGHISVAGFLLHSAYLSCIFFALREGVAQATLALIAGMQPLLTAALVGRVLGERVSWVQAAGFVLGFGGLFLVMSDRANLAAGTTLGYVVAAATPVLITAGSLYQKRFCGGMDLRAGMLIQHGTAFVTTGVFALLIEENSVEPTWELGFALIWLVVFLSIGATNLYFILLRRGEAARVSSLFYLTPPTTVVLGWLTYNETFGLTALAGFAVAGFGVFLVTRRGGITG